MNFPARISESGSFQVLALSTFSLIAVFVLMMLSAVRVEADGVSLEEDRLQAFALAEAAINVASDELVERVANFEPLDDTSASNNNLDDDDDDDAGSEKSGSKKSGSKKSGSKKSGSKKSGSEGGDDYDDDDSDPNRLISGSLMRRGTTASWMVLRATTGPEREVVPPSNRIDEETGLRSIVERYEIRAEATVGRRRAVIVRHVKLEKTPIFQFMAFYSGDLEVHPGPAMTLDGRIHANGSLYFGAGKSLSIKSHYFRAAHGMHRRRKGSGGSQNGWVELQHLATNEMVRLPSDKDLDKLGIDSANGMDSDFTGWDLNGDKRFDLPGEMLPFKDVTDSLFGGTLQTSEHGVTPVGHPHVGSIQAFVEREEGDFIEDSGNAGEFVQVASGTGTHDRGHFHERAALRIVDDRVFDNNGTDITSSMPKDFLTERTLYEGREQMKIKVTVLDLARLGDMDGDPATLDPSPYYPENGLVYASRSDSTSANPTGVVLTGGSELNVPDTWDTANYGDGRPYKAKNMPEEAYPFGAAEKQGLTLVSASPVYIHGDFNTQSKKPAAVITDAVNLLSNKWNFKKKKGKLPKASHTTYNLAFITGNQESTSKNYNGGFENLPRFHENWGGKKCNILGSFVNLWESEIATGKWKYGSDRYKAPTRNWAYDPSFDAGELPPFTPLAIEIETLAWDTNR